MITFHYLPDNTKQEGELLSVTQQKNFCIYILCSKLGLSHSARLPCYSAGRNASTSRPRPRAGKGTAANLTSSPKTVMKANDQLAAKVKAAASSGVRLVLAVTQAELDLKATEKDPNFVPFTLTTCGSWPSIWDLPYHGYVDKLRRQVNLFSAHTKYMLPGLIPDERLKLADDTTSIFATLAGIQTVRPEGFANYMRANVTSTTLWSLEWDNKSTSLTTLFQMLRVEQSYNYRFTL